MGLPVTVVTAGGIAVTEALNGRGLPVSPIVAGGLAVTQVTSGGLAVVGLDAGSDVPPNYRTRAMAGAFVFSFESMDVLAGFAMQAQAGAFAFADPGNTNLVPPTAAYTGPGDLTGWGTAYGYWGLRAYNASKIGANCIDVCANFTGAAVSLTTVVIGSNGYVDLTPIGFSPIYVNRIYDQSGTQDLFFPLIGGRPNIATSVVGGKPAIFFPESYPMLSSSNAVAQAQPLTFATVLSTTAGAGTINPFSDGTATSLPFLFSNTNQLGTNLGVFTSYTPCTDNVFHSLIVVAQGTTGSGTTQSVDGTRATVTGNVGSGAIASTNKLTMGAGSEGGSMIFRGYIFEVIVKAGSVSTTNQDALTTNQHAIGTGW